MIRETGTITHVRPVLELVSIETFLRRRVGTAHDHDSLREFLPPRPGWPEDFRVPHFKLTQGCA